MSSASVAAPPARLVAPRTRPSAAQQQRDTAAAGSDGRRPERAPSMDPLSDKATLMLIRRVLCPQKLSEKDRDVVTPIEELLPSLTSRNDVDLQLYAFLAIIIRDFVQAWYNKITPDETFVAEVLQVIAHCSRALEQRFRTLDVESLVLDEIPDLLDKHIAAYRTSHDPVSQEPVAVNPRQVYHALCPLPQLSPVPQKGDQSSFEEQQENESAYRQLLVQAVLAILLPTEDLENPCLTAIVGQIFSELIVGNILAGKASQPWLLYESICIAGRVLGEKKTRATQRMVSGRHTPPALVLLGTRLLSHYIQQLFSASHLPGLLRTLRGVLFPNNALGKSTLAPPSSDDEFVALRKRAAGALLGLLPTGVAKVYLGSKSGDSPEAAAAQEDDMVDGMAHLLMVLNDEYCNKHLMYSVLELILVRLMPELSEKGVCELWEERLG
ncbi:translational activator for mitochondrial COX1 [Beauveria asiatica]|uniref:Translational activator for mitochondrial COX1 n=1 Tax=Beauveria asiatica TaxID=1069075 RepID=A0AAW0RYV3_9HYPO